MQFPLKSVYSPFLKLRQSVDSDFASINESTPAPALVETLPIAKKSVNSDRKRVIFSDEISYSDPPVMNSDTESNMGQESSSERSNSSKKRKDRHDRLEDDVEIQVEETPPKKKKKKSKKRHSDGDIPSSSFVDRMTSEYENPYILKTAAVEEAANINYVYSSLPVLDRESDDDGNHVNASMVTNSSPMVRKKISKDSESKKAALKPVVEKNETASLGKAGGNVPLDVQKSEDPKLKKRRKSKSKIDGDDGPPSTQLPAETATSLKAKLPTPQLPRKNTPVPLPEVLRFATRTSPKPTLAKKTIIPPPRIRSLSISSASSSTSSSSISSSSDSEVPAPVPKLKAAIATTLPETSKTSKSPKEKNLENKSTAKPTTTKSTAIEAPSTAEAAAAAKVIDNWETLPSRPSANSLHRVENIAFSSSYIASQPGSSLALGAASFQVIRLGKGVVRTLVRSSSESICSVARGRVAVNVDGVEAEFRIEEGGLWRVRGGEGCVIRGDGEEEGVVYVVGI